MDTIEPNTASSRAEMRCPDCWEEGLIEDEDFATRHDDPDEKIINATRCPNDDCDTGRVTPREVERQYITDSGGLFGLSVSDFFRKSVIGVVAVMLVLGLWVGVPLLTNSSAIGGGQATDADAVAGENFSVAYTSSGPVIKNGDMYMDGSGSISSTPHYFESPSSAQQTYSRSVEEDGQDESGSSTNGGNNNDQQDTNNDQQDTDSTETGSGSSDVTVVAVEGSETSSTESNTENDQTTVVVEDELQGQTVSADNTSGTQQQGEAEDEDSDGLLTEGGEGTSVAQSARLSGTVITPNGTPISGASVTLSPVGRSMLTADQGKYLFDNTPPGDYTLRADMGDSSTVVDITVTDNGDVRINTPTENAIYTTLPDTQLIRGGSIDLIRTEKYDVLVRGKGSEMGAPLRFSNTRNANDVSVTLTPEQQQLTKSYTLSTTDTPDDRLLSTDLSLSENVSETQFISLSSTPGSRSVTRSGTAIGDEQITVPGNTYPTDVEVTLRNSGSTRDASVTIDGRTYGPVTTQELPRTYIIPPNDLQSGTQTVEFDTSRGKVDYEFSFNSRTVAEQGSVQLNDKSWDLQEIADGPVTRSYDKNTKEIKVIKSGENDIQLTTRDIDGMRPTLGINIVHSGVTKSTKNPTVTVTDPSGTERTQTIPDEYLSDGELTEKVKLSIPQSWFGEGLNRLTIQTEDGPEVRAKLTVTGVTERVTQFD